MRLILLCTSLALFSTGCLKAQSGASHAQIGPMDGTYLLRSRTCGNTVLPETGRFTRYVVKGSMATLSTEYPNACVVVRVATLSYPTAGRVVSTTQKVTCSSSCSGAECTSSSAVAEPETFDYSVAGHNLLLSPAKTGCHGRESIDFTGNV